MAKKTGLVEISSDRCKGCALCVDSCPTGSLQISTEWNRLGYHPVEFLPGTGCTGCGVCFYACPEPAAIEVLKVDEPAGESKTPTADARGSQWASN